MDREHIMNVFVKHFKANVDVPDDFVINPELSAMDQGAESLDLVEIVSASMRELKIKVPRTKLRDLKNINELVDLFYAVSLEGSTAGPETRGAS